MGGVVINSSLVEANQKKNALNTAARDYSGFIPDSMRSLSDGNPPICHDSSVQAYKQAAAEYVGYLQRDADAIEQIGFAFSGKDRETAKKLLGY